MGKMGFWQEKWLSGLLWVLGLGRNGPWGLIIKCLVKLQFGSLWFIRSSPLRNLWQNYTFGPWTYDIGNYLGFDFDQ
nr:hypothetical protein [Tanacetum cinerariifolium]